MEFLRNLADLIFKIWPPIHKEGKPFVLVALAITFVTWAISPFLGLISLVVAGWVVFFFRDPDRITPIDNGLAVSPADGVISKIEKVEVPEYIGVKTKGKVYRISIFLNVFNVHVNRVPIEGEIKEIIYNPGKFLSANLDKASIENESNAIVIKTKNNKTLICTQIAGLVARRIVCYLDENQKVQTGERYGIIRFGSRADIYLPEGVNPLVAEGQLAVGGETILADINAKNTARKGEIRE